MKRKLVLILLTCLLTTFILALQPRIPHRISMLSQPSALAASPAVNDSWTIECVDCPRNFGFQGNHMLQLDSSDYPHIAYAGKNLYYAWYDGTAWHSEIIPDAPGGSGAVLALDGNDHPHIIYTSSYPSALKYCLPGCIRLAYTGYW